MNMFARSLFFVLLLFGCSKTGDHAPTEEVKKVSRPSVAVPNFPSPAALVQQTVGRATVSISYSRPSVISAEGIDRTGKIWGGLVPYDFDFRPAMGGGKPRPWRAGANENTIITFSHDALIAGKPIEAGTYGLHMAIHERGGATVIFSKKSDAWGSFAYEQQDDALRVEVATETIQATHRLIYSFIAVDKTSTTVALDWEMKRIPFTITFDTHTMVLSDYRNALADTVGISWNDYYLAARYCATNQVNLEEAMQWIEKSLAMDKNYKNVSIQSVLLHLTGRTEEAIKVKDEALGLSTTEANDFYSYGTELIAREKHREAMEIFQRLKERWPEHWLAAHGLARAYAAFGDYKKALEYERQALGKAPEPNRGFIEAAMKKLEEGKDFN